MSDDEDPFAMMESLLGGSGGEDNDAGDDDDAGDDFADLAALLDGGLDDDAASDDDDEPAAKPAEDDAFAQLAAAMGQAAPAAEPDPEPEQPRPEEERDAGGVGQKIVSENDEELELELDGTDYMVDKNTLAVFDVSEPDAAEVGRWDVTARRIMFADVDAAAAPKGRLRSATDKLDDELGDLLASSGEEEEPAAGAAAAAAAAAAEPAVAEVASIAAAAIEQQLSDEDVQALVLAKSAEEWCRAEIGAPHASDCADAMSRAMVETVGDLMLLVPSAAAVSTSLELPLDAAHALCDSLAPYAEMMGLDATDTAAADNYTDTEQPEEGASSSATRRSKIEERLTVDDAERTIREEQERRVAWLTQVPMFNLAEEEGVATDRSFMEDLARKLEASTVRRGVLIIEKGQSGDEMFFIARGEAEVLGDLDEGTPAFSILTEGNFFGEGALLEDEPRNAYVRVLSGNVKLMALSRSNLLAVFRDYPDVEASIRRPLDQRKKERQAAAEAEAEAEAAAAEYSPEEVEEAEDEYREEDADDDDVDLEDILAEEEEEENELPEEEEEEQEEPVRRTKGGSIAQTRTDKPPPSLFGGGSANGRGSKGGSKDFGTRMHEQAMERQAKNRRQRAELEEAQRQTRPPPPKIHTKNFGPKHTAISAEQARNTGLRLYVSAQEKQRKVAEARTVKEAEELAIARAAKPQVCKASRKYNQGKGTTGFVARQDAWGSSRTDKRTKALEERQSMAKQNVGRLEIGFGGTSPLAPPSPLHRDGRHGTNTRDGWAEHDAERLAVMERLADSNGKTQHKLEAARAAQRAAERDDMKSKVSVSSTSARLARVARERSESPLSNRRHQNMLADQSGTLGAVAAAGGSSRRRREPGASPSQPKPGGRSPNGGGKGRRKPSPTRSPGDQGNQGQGSRRQQQSQCGLPTGLLLHHHHQQQQSAAVGVDVGSPNGIARGQRQAQLAHHAQELEILPALRREDEEREKDLYTGFSPRQMASAGATAIGVSVAGSVAGSVVATPAHTVSVGATPTPHSTRSRGARQLPTTKSVSQAVAVAVAAEENDPDSPPKGGVSSIPAQHTHASAPPPPSPAAAAAVSVPPAVAGDESPQRPGSPAATVSKEAEVVSRVAHEVAGSPGAPLTNAAANANASTVAEANKVRRHFVREAEAALAILKSAVDTESLPGSPDTLSQRGRRADNVSPRRNRPGQDQLQDNGTPVLKPMAVGVALSGRERPAAPKGMSGVSIEHIEHAASWVARYGAEFHKVLLGKHESTEGWEFLSAPMTSREGRYYRSMIQYATMRLKELTPAAGSPGAADLVAGQTMLKDLPQDGKALRDLIFGEPRESVAKKSLLSLSVDDGGDGTHRTRIPSSNRKKGGKRVGRGSTGYAGARGRVASPKSLRQPRCVAESPRRPTRHQSPAVRQQSSHASRMSSGFSPVAKELADRRSRDVPTDEQVLQHPELFSFTSKGTKASRAKALEAKATPTKLGATPKRGMKVGGSSPRSKKKSSAASAAAVASLAAVVKSAEHAPPWQDTVNELLSPWSEKDTRQDAEILLVFYLNFEPSSAATDKLSEIMTTFKNVGEKREKDWRTLMYSNFNEKYKIDPRSYYKSAGPQDGKLSRRAYNVKKGKAALPVPKLEDPRSPRGTALLGRSQRLADSADHDAVDADTSSGAGGQGALCGAVMYKATAPLPTTSREAAAQLAAAGGQLSAFVVDGLTNVQEVANGRYDMQKTVQSEDRPTYKQAKRAGAGSSCWLYYAGGAWLLSPGLGAEECYGYMPSTATEPPEEGSAAGTVWLVPVQSATESGGWEWATAPQVRVRRWLAGQGDEPQLSLSISQSKAGAAAVAAEAAGMPNLSAAAAAIAAAPAPAQKQVTPAPNHFFGGFGASAPSHAPQPQPEPEPEPEPAGDPRTSRRQRGRTVQYQDVPASAVSLSAEATRMDSPTSLAADFFAATGDIDTGGVAVDDLVIIEETAEELICLLNDQEYLVDLESDMVFHVVPGSDDDPAEVGTWSHDSRRIFFIDDRKPSGSSLDVDPNLAATLASTIHVGLQQAASSSDSEPFAGASRHRSLRVPDQATSSTPADPKPVAARPRQGSAASTSSSGFTKSMWDSSGSEDEGGGDGGGGFSDM